MWHVWLGRKMHMEFWNRLLGDPKNGTGVDGFI
jgi:hypothetical protein